VSRSRVPGLLLLAAAAWHLSVFASVALGRLSYPFEVEFLEGLTIDYAKTLAAGGNLYAPPSLHFAPNWYPPLHYLVSLPVLWLSGWQLWGARLVSIASVVGASVIGVRLLRGLGASWSAALVTTAVTFAYYPQTYYWYDVARVDSLQVFFAVAGLACLAADGVRPAPQALYAGATLLTLSVFTKQTGVVSCLAALLYFAADGDRLRRNRLAVSLAVLAAAGGALMLAAYGRDAFIIYWAPQRHFRNIPVGTWRFVEFAWTMAPLAGFAILGLRGTAGTDRGRALRFLLTGFAATLAMGWLTLCKHGGERNSSMPAIFLLALCVGLAYDRNLVAPAASWRPVWFSAVLGGYLLAAFPSDRLAWIPSALDRKEANELLADMRAAPGPFLAYNASFVSTLLRGEMYPYRDRLYDWAGGQNQGSHFIPDPSRYPQDFLEAVRRHAFTAIYTDGSDQQGDYVYKLIVENYRPLAVWDAALAAGEPPVRWRNALPRVKWVAR
jgi:4-amino-4-deoxy-L-arabinose transferase-like glycosyltransferase